jgi:hypothetical protein
MDHNPFHMHDPLRELQEQIERTRQLMSMTALDQVLEDAKRLNVDQITKTVLSPARLLPSVYTTAEELVKQMDIRRYIEAYDPMKQIRQMNDFIDNQLRALRPPPLPDESADESEEDTEEEW